MTTPSEWLLVSLNNLWGVATSSTWMKLHDLFLYNKLSTPILKQLSIGFSVEGCKFLLWLAVFQKMHSLGDMEQKLKTVRQFHGFFCAKFFPQLLENWVWNLLIGPIVLVIYFRFCLTNWARLYFIFPENLYLLYKITNLSASWRPLIKNTNQNIYANNQTVKQFGKHISTKIKIEQVFHRIKSFTTIPVFISLFSRNQFFQ